MERALTLEVRQFSSSCERLLALAAKGAILTDEEHEMTRYDVSELGKAFDQARNSPFVNFRG